MVKLPSYLEALQMFCMCAFGQKDPNDGFGMLACEVINLVGKLPLGIRVMGSHFRGMSEHDWREALPSLRTHLDRDRDIVNILKFSYDALRDEDKRLFLHIACFFNLEPVDIVEGCLAKCFLDVTQGVRVLVEKSLISIEYNRIEMAELLVHFGRNIVREQSDSQPGKHQFLNKPIDIHEVLSDDKSDSGSVIGIDLNEDTECTTERAFERLSNLQFLRIFGKGVNPQSMNYISQKLRVLIWLGSEMTCFPSNFNPKFLAKLHLQDSKLEKLWGEIKPLNNLKCMDLRNSSNLEKLPDLSTATNLQKLNLSYCSRLEELPDLSTDTNLQELNLSYCSRLEELPDLSTATNLQNFYLSYCSRLVELSLSIGNAINLQKLDLSHCSRLVKLSLSIGNAINLQKLDLSHCSRLVELSSSIGSAVNLQEINLEYCSSLVRLPFSFENAVNLESMNLKYCSSLVELPFSMRNLGRLSKLELKGCSLLEVNQANINLESLDELDLSDCSSLKSYHESSTDIQELDPWIGRISRLQKLVLNGMKKLTSLQQLPDSVVELDASHCFSLERLDCTFCNPGIHLNFKSCFELNQEAIDLIIHTPMMNITEMNIIWKTEFTNHGRL
ncbi:hypothetical protein F2Q68_00006069 [Brassica cretica]|uniref:Disease resistance protein Roq1-like winged-helix domain-containing protein n=1 Tax=Brassica cretica TaxID=69181 RepID=A0A8S9JD76_BRACR|nr:hypothetical protein F2Q68_00006069 [Brassica cretica]